MEGWAVHARTREAIEARGARDAWEGVWGAACLGGPLHELLDPTQPAPLALRARERCPAGEMVEMASRRARGRLVGSQGLRGAGMRRAGWRAGGMGAEDAYGGRCRRAQGQTRRSAPPGLQEAHPARGPRGAQKAWAVSSYVGRERLAARCSLVDGGHQAAILAPRCSGSRSRREPRSRRAFLGSFHSLQFGGPAATGGPPAPYFSAPGPRHGRPRGPCQVARAS